MDEVAKKVVGQIPLIGGLIGASIALVLVIQKNNKFSKKIQDANKDILFDLAYADALFQLLRSAKRDNKSVLEGELTLVERVSKHVLDVNELIKKIYPETKTRFQSAMNWNNSEAQFHEIKDKLNELKNDLNMIYEGFDITNRDKKIEFDKDLMAKFEELSAEPSSVKKIEEADSKKALLPDQVAEIQNKVNQEEAAADSETAPMLPRAAPPAPNPGVLSRFNFFRRNPNPPVGGRRKTRKSRRRRSRKGKTIRRKKQ
jgi:hypothetical protein